MQLNAIENQNDHRRWNRREHASIYIYINSRSSASGGLYVNNNNNNNNNNLREFGFDILPSFWCEAGVRNIGFLAHLERRFAHRAPEHYLYKLGFELDYFTDILNRAPFFGGKITPKIKLLLLLRSGHLRQKP